RRHDPDVLAQSVLQRLDADRAHKEMVAPGGYFVGGLRAGRDRVRIAWDGEAWPEQAVDRESGVTPLDVLRALTSAGRCLGGPRKPCSRPCRSKLEGPGSLPPGPPPHDCLRRPAPL